MTLKGVVLNTTEPIERPLDMLLWEAIRQKDIVRPGRLVYVHFRLRDGAVSSLFFECATRTTDFVSCRSLAREIRFDASMTVLQLETLVCVALKVLERGGNPIRFLGASNAEGADLPSVTRFLLCSFYDDLNTGILSQEEVQSARRLAFFVEPGARSHVTPEAT